MFKIHFLLLTAMSISVISVFFCINKERKVQETIKDPLKEKREPFKRKSRKPLKKNSQKPFNKRFQGTFYQDTNL